ncbi:GIY-YIG nuclease family protein [Priestia megaterium]|uniref:GIY-YIG nuclease family protein n=1 Tax=Priestia megaterium TaxID=1404 RepID=UPI0030082D2A
MAWNYSKYQRGLTSSIPKRSGIYAILHVVREHGFPISHRIIYVGKSNNLQRRWKEHLDPNEKNPSIRKVQHSDNLEFWWRPYPLSKLSEVESELIKKIKPYANTVGV